MNSVLEAIANHPWAFGYLALALLLLVAAARR